MLKILLAALLAQDAKDPQEVLTAYRTDLQKAINSSPGKDSKNRPKLEAAAKAVFDREIRTSLPKTPKTAWDFIVVYLENLVQADKHFGTEDTKPERTAWIAACKATLTQQLAHAKDPGNGTEPPTTEETFEALLSAMGKVKSTFISDTSSDLRTAAYTQAKSTFATLIPKARGCGKKAQSFYTEMLVRIDKHFPLVTDKDKQVNSDPNTQLRAAAKSAFDREVAAGGK